MMIRALRRFRLWAVFGILFTLSLIIVLADRGSLPPFITALYDFPLGDKVGHFFLMGLLALALNLLFPNQQKQKRAIQISNGSKLALILVTLEEISQLGFATRSFSIVDLSFSYLGILSMEILIRLWKHHR
jgi:polysaccharide biosynthesis protein VpsQ